MNRLKRVCLGLAPASRLVAFASLFCLMPSLAFAYIRPGAGMGVIAVIVALGFGLVLLIGGFVWYPLKRLRRSRKKQGVARRSG